MKRLFYLLLFIIPCITACDVDVDKGVCSVYGTVIDTNTGDPVPGATVILDKGHHVFSQETTITGSDGYYRFDNVDAESVFPTVQATKAGYRDSEIFRVYAGKGQVVKIDIPL